MAALAVASLALVLTPGHAQTPPAATTTTAATISWKGFEQQVTHSDDEHGYLVSEKSIAFCKDTSDNKYCLAPMVMAGNTSLVFCRMQGGICPTNPDDCGKNDKTVAVLNTEDTLFYTPDAPQNHAQPVTAPQSGTGE